MSILAQDNRQMQMPIGEDKSAVSLDITAQHFQSSILCKANCTSIARCPAQSVEVYLVIVISHISKHLCQESSARDKVVVVKVKKSRLKLAHEPIA